MKVLEGVAIVCDGVWQEVGVDLICVLYCVLSAPMGEQGCVCC